jgi:bifunctional DNA-binding transcriptional regulator/antitoxin component of YhaV-PrlF toxin-antitoxin module
MPCQKAKYKIVCAESTLLKMDLLTLDQFGRLLIPNEIREQLGLTNTTQFTVVIQDGKLILEPLPQESKVYYSGTALVVESEPIGNLETALEDLREERIREFITSSENPV